MSTAAYLERLGLAADLPPDARVAGRHPPRALRAGALHQPRHHARPPAVGRAAAPRSSASSPPVAPATASTRTARSSTVLLDLGFAVERRHGHVWTTPEHRDETDLTHLVLLVTGLPTDANPGGRWWADVGLGEGPIDPVPLVAGASPTARSASRSPTCQRRPDGWSFANDPTGSFAGLEVRRLPAGAREVDAAHAALSTPPDGAFTRVLVVQRRDAAGSDTVRGLRRHPHRRRRHAPPRPDDVRRLARRARRHRPGGRRRARRRPARPVRPRAWRSHRAWVEAGRP